ncbi:MAG: hypothetical protein M1838_000396 [Thelocarpon superellum]|nr:MAG: hypothetical protein M1838_000396 [Thelocarpon superellum]
MPRLGRIFILSAAAVLSELAPPVDAHGHDHASPGTESGSTGAVSNGTMHSISDSDRVPSYFGLSSYSESISAHIALMITAWVFLLPLCVMLSIARSRFTFPLQIVFLAVNAGGLVTGTIYNANTPDLYQNNAHHKLGWIVTWMVSGQVALGLVGLYNRHFGSRAGEFVQRESYFPVSVDAMATHQRTHLLQSSHTDRFSEDSGQGTERSSTTLRSPTGEEQRSREQLMSDAEEDGQAYDSEGLGRGMEKPSFLPGSAAHRFLASKLTGILSRRATRVCMFVYETLNRTILIVGFVALTSGIVTYGGLFRGRQIFNGLAHFIKGGIFFWYGLLTLGRWMGCFADIGWAWNLKPSKAAVGQGKGNAPSAEFVEAFLYFLYGSTNVFLEHLGHWGGAYTGQDLEHISISILAFGGGLCGMLVESRRVSDLLNSRANDIAARSTENFNRADGKWDYSPTSKISMNPMPGIVTLLLGVIMSSHHQESMTATMVHAQVGLSN